MKRILNFLPLLFLPFLIHSSTLNDTSNPDEHIKFDNYKLKINGLSHEIQTCRVSAMPLNQIYPGYNRPLYQTELAGFSSWDLKGSTFVEIESKEAIKSVKIRPLSLGIKPQIKGNKITFRLDKPQKFVVEVNGFHHALHLFANAPETNIPEQNTPNVRFFGPGEHIIGNTELHSNESVYIDAKAVVYGNFFANDASNIHIFGRGILNVIKLPRGNGALNFNRCSNISIEGIILTEPNAWCFSMFGCNNVNINNIKLIGLWNYNTDGIDICNCQNVKVEDCFIRSFDDALVVKGVVSYAELPVSNIHFKNNIVWCDWGKALEIGAETVAPEISNIVFENCDIIRTLGLAMDITSSDNADIHDIRFEDIRLEIDKWNPTPKIQAIKNENYTIDSLQNFCPMLVQIQILKTDYTQVAERSKIHDITFKNIKITTENKFPISSFAGYDETHKVSNVVFDNLWINNHHITQVKKANFSIKSFVNRIKFY
ncbi:MAG: glycosyl hydrolase family 28 protein [Paludibacter sp.]|nr:glycosyl hydrolase family 28 protein [Paludibacter sp.]